MRFSWGVWDMGGIFWAMGEGRERGRERMIRWDGMGWDPLPAIVSTVCRFPDGPVRSTIFTACISWISKMIIMSSAKHGKIVVGKKKQTTI